MKACVLNLFSLLLPLTQPINYFIITKLKFCTKEQEDNIIYPVLQLQKVSHTLPNQQVSDSHTLIVQFWKLQKYSVEIFHAEQ